MFKNIDARNTYIWCFGCSWIAFSLPDEKLTFCYAETILMRTFPAYLWNTPFAHHRVEGPSTSSDYIWEASMRKAMR